MEWLTELDERFCVDETEYDQGELESVARLLHAALAVDFSGELDVVNAGSKYSISGFPTKIVVTDKRSADWLAGDLNPLRKFGTTDAYVVVESANFWNFATSVQTLFEAITGDQPRVKWWYVHCKSGHYSPFTARERDSLSTLRVTDILGECSSLAAFCSHKQAALLPSVKLADIRTSVEHPLIIHSNCSCLLFKLVSYIPAV